MIRLSNGHAFEYMAAAGALGYDGQGWIWEQPLRLTGLINPDWSLFEPKLFTVVTKTLTPQPTAGNLRWTNPFNSLAFIPDGVVNAIGLSNPGFGWWCTKVAPTIKKKSLAVIVSITADDLDVNQLSLMASRLDNYEIFGLELNASCPNTNRQMIGADEIIAACQAIKAQTRLPLILKLSVRHPAEQIVVGTKTLVEAFSVNSIPWADIFPDRRSPLAHLGGGAVSGGAAQTLTWAYARRLVGLSQVPIIGPSIWRQTDLQSLRIQGMKALSFGSLWLKFPWKPTYYVRQDRLMNFRRLQKIQQLRPHYV